MKFFVDTADVTEIKKLNDIGIVDGVTTNPTIVAKSGRPIREVLAEICDIVDGKELDYEPIEGHDWNWEDYE